MRFKAIELWFRRLFSMPLISLPPIYRLSSPVVVAQWKSQVNGKKFLLRLLIATDTNATIFMLFRWLPCSRKQNKKLLSFPSATPFLPKGEVNWRYPRNEKKNIRFQCYVNLQTRGKINSFVETISGDITPCESCTAIASRKLRRNKSTLFMINAYNSLVESASNLPE